VKQQVQIVLLAKQTENHQPVAIAKPDISKTVYPFAHVILFLMVHRMPL
jgi:hypothetical protein